MKIVVVRRGLSRTRLFRVTRYRLLALVLLVVLFCMALGGAFTRFLLSTWERQNHFISESGLQQWQKALSMHQEEVARAKSNAENQIDALTLRLAELQVRMTRLDALGERLTVLADLDDGEFSFSTQPAVGGPSESGSTESMYSKPSFIDAIEQLSRQVDSREQQFDILANIMESLERSDETFVAGSPIKKGWLSSKFGERIDPFTGKKSWHSGIDMAGKMGSEIISVASGVVTWSGDRFGYGRMVEINHGNGYVTRYAHNHLNRVKLGELVERGQVVAEMGSSGRSTGPHVHFEVIHNGKHVDPQKYIYRENR